MTQAQAIEQSKTACTGIKDFTSTLAGWLRVFSRVYRRDLIPEDATIYAEALSDLSAEQVDAACRKAIQTCKFFPTIAEIRDQLDKAAEKAFELEAQDQWEKALAWVEQNFFPDRGVREGAPWLPAATMHAVGAAGGIRWIATCPQKELVWCRNHFLAAYKNVHETGQVEHLLSDVAAKKFVAKFITPLMPTLKQLPPEPEEPLPPRAEVRKVLDKVAQIPSEEEWEAHKRDLKERAAAWIAAHPEVQKPGGAGCSKNPSASEVASA